jgi:hypothetical protein
MISSLSIDPLIITQGDPSIDGLLPIFPLQYSSSSSTEFQDDTLSGLSANASVQSGILSSTSAQNALSKIRPPIAVDTSATVPRLLSSESNTIMSMLTTSKSTATVTSEKSLAILVVDDSLPVRKMCSMILTKQNHRVSTAINGKDALKLMAARFLNPKHLQIDDEYIWEKTKDSLRPIF